VKARLAYESHGAYIVSLDSDPSESVRIYDDRLGRLYWPVPLDDIDLDAWTEIAGDVEIHPSVEVMESDRP
jgi:hypothetical protein